MLSEPIRILDVETQNYWKDNYLDGVKEKFMNENKINSKFVIEICHH